MRVHFLLQGDRTACNWHPRLQWGLGLAGRMVEKWMASRVTLTPAKVTCPGCKRAMQMRSANEPA